MEEMKVSRWKIHWLEAEGPLEDIKGDVTAAVGIAQEVLGRHAGHQPLDILVQQRAGEVIPEIGVLGVAQRKSLFSLSVDTLNPNFASSLVDGTLSRHVAHEAHHCYRMAGPGYGRTLGEALVSEGLAGQFVSRTFASAPELWECAISLTELLRYLPRPEELHSTNYDHASWFFGTSPQRPRWLGYSLGYQIVAHWIEKVCPSEPHRWIQVSANEVLESGLAALYQMDLQGV
ncbi:hypothetical protein H681_14935 [Pseudomonas sp. ATCC 13867]|nr:hypothetical protein H681_14935 [Pseudomonas sp. ATCC 13867]